jgi:hypothetical protein
MVFALIYKDYLKYADNSSMKIDISSYISGLRKTTDVSSYIANLQKSMGQTLNPDQIYKDNMTRAALSRIKYARISRAQRDYLSSTVRAAAVEERIDHKFVKSVMDIVFLMEMGNAQGQKKENRLLGGSREKSVDDEMKQIGKDVSARKAQKEQLENLKTKFSAIA